MIGQMDTFIALPGFNDFGRSVTPIFFWWIIFSTDFLCLEKNEENLSTRGLNFIANYTIEFRFFTLPKSVRLY